MKSEDMISELKVRSSVVMVPSTEAQHKRHNNIYIDTNYAQDRTMVMLLHLNM